MISFPVLSLKTLPPAELDRLSQHFQYLADTCADFAKANRKRDHHTAYVRDYRKQIDATVDAIRAKIDKGLDEATALRKVVAETRLPEATIFARWRLHKKRKTRDYVKLRGQKIMQLKRRGHTNKEIAQKIGLSASQIGRIIAKISVETG
ncbi:hypothetical protein [Thalassospira sp. TSL5-1]|uniref:hypothetical protein n=1 Tax=Thalassospira sp. TSL5-1 TaxID=1544451 RepID=UPI00093E3223|nr:hypothetical protein [Thalassospira sp. TSL5-1]OKH89924.1 hypothetical protein LF95_08540 [Thalassospira sp. TSL5-1]